MAPYLTLLRPDAPRQDHDSYEVVNAPRRIVRARAPGRMLRADSPPWAAVCRQAPRRIAAGGCDDMVHDLRATLRRGGGRADAPPATILDGRTLQSTPESGPRAGDDGHKRRKGSKTRLAGDALGHLLALRVPPAGAPDRAQVATLAAAARAATGEPVEVAFVDQGHAGEAPAAAAAHGIRLEFVELPTAKRGCVLLPRRWVVERGFAWLSRFRRLARDHERLAEVPKRFYLLAFVMLMRKHALPVLGAS